MNPPATTAHAALSGERLEQRVAAAQAQED